MSGLLIIVFSIGNIPNAIYKIHKIKGGDFNMMVKLIHSMTTKA